MSLLLTRFAKAASFLILLAACGANDAGTGNKGPRGGNSPNDETELPPDGTDGNDGGFIDDTPNDGGSNVDPDAACAATSMESKAVPPAVMFQLDLSGSMQCRPTESGDCGTNAGIESRWHILREALKQALDSLPPDTLVGVMHYPHAFAIPGCATASMIDAAPKPLTNAHKADIRAKLDALTPVGGTATHQAMVDAYVELQKLQDSNKFIVLATDGEASMCVQCQVPPFCNMQTDNQAMVQGVEQVRQNDNVRTFVIGVPGSENFRTILSQMAKAGGTGKAGCGTDDCHFDMTTSPENFGESIAQVLGEISQQLLGCVYSIPEQDGSFDPGQVNVRFTEGGVETDIPRDPSKQDGWDYTPDGKQIELFGPTCDKVKASQQGRLDILFGCPTVVR